MKYKYPFTNTLTFALVMEDPKLSRGLLQLIFPEREIREVKLHEATVETEKTVIAGIELRKVRLDVLFEDSNEWYDIEMQSRNEHNIPKRSRYAHGIMDVHHLKVSRDFNDLKSSYVIFLCCFDPFDRGDAVYNFGMIDEEKNLPLGDENYTIVLNSKTKDPRIPEALRQLFRYMNDSIVSEDNELLLQIDEAVRSWNTGERLEIIMTLEEEILRKEALARKEGFEEGSEQKKLEIAKNLKNKGVEMNIIVESTGLNEETVQNL